MKKSLTLFFCGVMACSDITSGSGVVISLEVGPTQIQAGTEMNVDVLAQNATSSPVIVVIDECMSYFEIFQGDDVVGPAPRECSLGLPATDTLATGEVARVDDTWRGESNAAQTATQPVYLAPGTYTLRPRALLSSGDWVYGRAVTVRIQP